MSKGAEGGYYQLYSHDLPKPPEHKAVVRELVKASRSNNRTVCTLSRFMVDSLGDWLWMSWRPLKPEKEES
jgi:hypothetical protein